MTTVTVDYAALELDDAPANDIPTDIFGVVTAEVRNGIYDLPEVKAIVEDAIRDYLRSLTFECTYKGAKRVFNNAVEVANFYGELNEAYRSAYKTLMGSDSYKAEQARLFRKEIEDLKEEIISWAASKHLNTQRGNGQTKFGKGFVALRKVTL